MIEVRSIRWQSSNPQSPMELLVYGRYGRPVLFFGADQDEPQAADDAGLLDDLAGAVAAGEIKLYVVETVDQRALRDGAISAEERLARQEAYDRFIAEEVVASIQHDCRNALGIVAAGSGLGGYQALNVMARHPALFEAAVVIDPILDIEPYATEGGEALYFLNPMAYLPNLDDEHFLPLLQQRSVVLASSRGGRDDARRMAEILKERGIPCELQLRSGASAASLLAEPLIALRESVAAP